MTLLTRPHHSIYDPGQREEQGAVAGGGRGGAEGRGVARSDPRGGYSTDKTSSKLVKISVYFPEKVSFC